MRKFAPLSCAVSLALGGVALAADPGVLTTRLSGNTLAITQHGPSGGLVGVSHVRLAADGGYVSDNTVGQTMKGVWRATDTALCLTATDPLPPVQFRKENCLEVAKLDRWSVKSPRGGDLQYDLLPGHAAAALKPALPDVR